MTSTPQRRPGHTSRASRASRAAAAGGRTDADRTRRSRSGSSRPAGSRPATAPAASATGVSRRAGRGSTGAAPSAGRTLLPQSRLARQVAILGLVLCAVALSVAFPLRNYLQQRAELADAVVAQQSLEQQRDELQARKSALQDSAYVAAEARRRLQYVTPGETVFVVHAPAVAAGADVQAAVAVSDQPWYGSLWDTLAEPGTP
jgi:cell division protein FtsB